MLPWKPWLHTMTIVSAFFGSLLFYCWLHEKGSYFVFSTKTPKSITLRLNMCRNLEFWCKSGRKAVEMFVYSHFQVYLDVSGPHQYHVIMWSCHCPSPPPSFFFKPSNTQMEAPPHWLTWRLSASDCSFGAKLTVLGCARLEETK